MDWEDVRVQLIDTPPITADYLEGYLSSMVRVGRRCASCWSTSATTTAPSPPRPSSSGWRRSRRSWSATPPADPEDPTIEHVKTLLVANKIDADGAADRLEIVREMFGDALPDPDARRRVGRRAGGAARRRSTSS